MDKLKNVLSGHKNDDTVHDSSSTGAQDDGRSPICDQTSSQRGHIPSNTSQSYGENARPGVNPSLHQGLSEASIKSGVIGYGAGERQGHAAPPSNEPIPEELGRQESYTTDTDRSFPLAGGVTSRHPDEYTSSTHHPTTSAREPGTKEKEAGLRDGYGREELAGAGAAAAPLMHSERRDEQPYGQGATYGTQAYPASNVLEDGHGRKEYGGGSTSQPYGQSPASSYQPYTSSTHGPTSDTTSHTTHGHNPEALAAATAAATMASTQSSSTHGSGTGTSSGGLFNARPSENRNDDFRGHVPGGFPSPTPEESRTFLFYRDELVPEPGVEAPILHPGHHAAHDQVPLTDVGRSANPSTGLHGSGVVSPTSTATTTSHGQHSGTVGSGSSNTTTGPPSSSLLNKLDPRVDSDRDGSNTVGTAPTTYGTSSDVPSGQHELRHTGSLEQPTSRSTDVADDNHFSRDAALVGGVGAGTAGLGYAASQRHETSTAERGNYPQSSSLEQPTTYSADRADDHHHLGRDAALASGVGAGGLGYAASQRYETSDVDRDNLAKSSSHLQQGHSGNLEQPTSRSTDHADEHHNLGRDAALAGGVGAGATGLGYAASQRHETSTAERDNVPQGSGHLDHGSSPYSNKGLDPRALGSKANLEGDQSTHYAGAGASSSATGGENLTGPVHKSSLLNKIDPRVKKIDDTTSTTSPATHDDPKHHYGRDAALVGAGAGTAAGVHHELQRDDTAGNTAPTQTSLSQQRSSSSAPLSSTNPDAHGPRGQHNGPDYVPYEGPLTTSGSPFYGAAGAPAPIVDDHSRSHEPAGGTTQHQSPEHHYGRDAGLAGGAAAAGGLAYESQRDRLNTGSQVTHHQAGSTAEDPASKTVGKHSSNIMNVLDPRVLPDPSKQKDHTTTGPHTSDTLNRMDPKVEETAGTREHHYGRDAAVVGGIGAAGYGAHEAADAYGQHRMTQPDTSMNEQRYAPSSTGALSSYPVQSGQYDSGYDHTGRNAALGTGLGAGALGGAAYAGSRHADNTQQIPMTSSQPYSSSTQPGLMTSSYPETGTLAPQNTQSTVPGAIHDRYASTHDPRDTGHTKRDAALLGTGVAAGAAAYTHNENDDKRAEKEQEKIIHKHEKEVAAHEKEQHKHDLAEQNRLEKERVKEAAKLDKERTKHTEATHEKKPGFLSNLLHRDKSKKEKRSSMDASPRQSTDARGSYDNPRHSKEYAGLGAATTAAAYAEHDHDRNRLHKDPPPGHPAREALESQHEMGELSNKRAHIGTDGPIGGPAAYNDQSPIQSGVYGARSFNEVPAADNRVTEPHTGLPMNVGKYGDGRGGTDANPTVEGHHRVAGVDENVRTGHGVTDWDNVRKNDTPY